VKYSTSSPNDAKPSNQVANVKQEYRASMGTGSPSTVLNLEGERVVRGLMQNQPLLPVVRFCNTLIGFTANTEIVSRTVEGPIYRYTYKHAARPGARKAG